MILGKLARKLGGSVAFETVRNGLPTGWEFRDRVSIGSPGRTPHRQAPDPRRVRPPYLFGPVGGPPRG